MRQERCIMLYEEKNEYARKEESMFGHRLIENVLAEGHLYLFIPRFNCFVERCSKSSCTLCTLRLLRSVRLAPESLMAIHRGALKK